MLMTVNDDIATLRSAVAELVPAFQARAGEGERLRTMPADLVIRAKEAGLFRLNLPRALGGYELEPAATVEILEEISRADGSAGWTLVIGNSTAFFAWLDPVVAKEMIGQQPDFVSTSMWAPLGQATAQPGGFTVSGRWPFNSGCPHATWLQVGVLVTEAGRPRTLACGAPDWRFAFVPARSAVIEDTWDAMGLCGTGSHHLSLSRVPVPAERLAAPFFEPARHDGPLWRIPLITLAAMFLAAVPLGIARRALEEFTALAVRKVRGAARPERRPRRGGPGRAGPGRGGAGRGAFVPVRCDRRRLGYGMAGRRAEPGPAGPGPAGREPGRAGGHRGGRPGVPPGRRGRGVRPPPAPALLPRHPRRGSAHLVQCRPGPGLR